MLGRHHLTLSLGTVALVVLPLFTVWPTVVIIALVGTAIGSLIPDADSQDAAIFHSDVRGLRGGPSDLANAPAVLYPVFGVVTKWAIYKPAVRFYGVLLGDEYNITERHRGFLHSFLGLATITVVTGLYMLPILFFLELLWLAGVVVFLGGYLAGAFLHLLEDSCTKTGIEWNFPFQSWKLKGRLTTTARSEDIRYQRGFLSVLGVGSLGMFLAPSVIDGLSVLLLSAAGAVLATVLWLVFAVGIAGCRLYRG